MSGRMIGVTSSKLLRHYWYPVARSGDLHHAPLGLRLLGRDLVIWRGPAGEVVAAPDRCPHRMAELSAGVVTEGVLSCPSHGWQFGDGGQCLRAGMMGGIPDTAHLATVRSDEQHGLVWVCLEEPAASIPALGGDNGAERLVTLPVERWKVVAMRVTERVIETTGTADGDVDLPFVCHVPVDGASRASFVVTPVDDFHSLVTVVARPDGADHDVAAAGSAALLAQVRAVLDAAGTPVSAAESGAAATWRTRLEAAVTAG